MLGNRKDRGGGGAKKISLFPSPILHRLTDCGRKVVTLTRPNKTPVLQANDIEADFPHGNDRNTACIEITLWKKKSW